jgi:hypothetical protein
MVARDALPLLAACLLAAVSAAQADSAHLSVTATIPALAQFRVVTAPQLLELTPQDIARGHVDVALPSVVLVRTNIAGGFAVRVLMDPQVVAAATVTGFDAVAHVAGGFGLLRVPGPQRQDTQYELRWRLQLAPQVQAGSYSWPVEMRLDGL